jgi:hypothetical protein
MSTGQVEMRNSERRRKAPVRSCACMRLESAMRTVMALESGAGEGLMKRELQMQRIKERPDLRGETRGTQGNMSHYSVDAFKSGKMVVMLWKSDDEPDWERGISGFRERNVAGARVWSTALSRNSSSGCDAANMQVYFCG